jgi:hypothetical protein
MDALEVETLSESSGHCDCCGQVTHSIWGTVTKGSQTVAAYWASWSEGHLEELGADFDLVVGTWGDEAGPEARAAISAAYRMPPQGGFMIIDGKDRMPLAAHQLKRTDVIGTPLAEQVFNILDAIWLKDNRLFSSEGEIRV